MARRSQRSDKSGNGRDRLIAAAIELFGRRGLDGTSTREIARKAEVNIAGIAYHFGGKRELYLACAEHIAKVLRAGIAAQGDGAAQQTDPRERLKSMIARLAHVMLASPDVAPFARFVLREHMDPSPALDVLYAGVMEPMHSRLCALWAEATGNPPDAERTKLKIFALLSQVLVFRMARAGALRRMGWSDLGPREFAMILANAEENLDALLARELETGK